MARKSRNSTNTVSNASPAAKPRKAYKRKQKVEPVVEDEIEEQRLFKNPKLINDHLICPICTDVFNNPFRLTCGHSFCKTCIDQWIKTNPTCPVDRNPVVMKFCHKDFVVENIIGEYQIACPWRQFGCLVLDKYSVVKDHKDGCRFNINKVDPVLRRRMLDELKRSEQQKEALVTAVQNDEVSKPPLKKGKSALDFIMSQMNDSDVLTETEENEIPEAVVPPLSMRLYLSATEKDRNLLSSILK